MKKIILSLKKNIIKLKKLFTITINKKEIKNGPSVAKFDFMLKIKNHVLKLKNLWINVNGDRFSISIFLLLILLTFIGLFNENTSFGGSQFTAFIIKFLNFYDALINKFYHFYDILLSCGGPQFTAFIIKFLNFNFALMNKFLNFYDILLCCGGPQFTALINIFLNFYCFLLFIIAFHLVLIHNFYLLKFNQAVKGVIKISFFLGIYVYLLLILENYINLPIILFLKIIQNIASLFFTIFIILFIIFCKRLEIKETFYYYKTIIKLNYPYYLILFLIYNILTLQIILLFYQKLDIYFFFENLEEKRILNLFYFKNAPIIWIENDIYEEKLMNFSSKLKKNIISYNGSLNLHLYNINLLECYPNLYNKKLDLPFDWKYNLTKEDGVDFLFKKKSLINKYDLNYLIDIARIKKEYRFPIQFEKFKEVENIITLQNLNIHLEKNLPRFIHEFEYGYNTIYYNNKKISFLQDKHGNQSIYSKGVRMEEIDVLMPPQPQSVMGVFNYLPVTVKIQIDDYGHYLEIKKKVNALILRSSKLKSSVIKLYYEQQNNDITKNEFSFKWFLYKDFAIYDYNEYISLKNKMQLLSNKYSRINPLYINELEVKPSIADKKIENFFDLSWNLSQIFRKLDGNGNKYNINNEKFLFNEYKNYYNFSFTFEDLKKGHICFKQPRVLNAKKILYMNKNNNLFLDISIFKRSINATKILSIQNTFFLSLKDPKTHNFFL